MTTGAPSGRVGQATVPAREIRWGRGDAVVGVVGAVLLMLVADWALSKGWITDPRLAELLGYVVVWVPLLGAVLVACFVRGSGSLARDFGLRFRALDLLWGLTIGLLARVAASLIEIAGYGSPGTGAATLDAPAPEAWWVFAALLAPVVIAPVIEEVFFRGLLLRAVAGATDAARPVGLAVAVIVSGAVFALVHLVDAGTGMGAATAIVVGASTFVFGVGAASVAVATGRLGGAIIAHVTFNALVVVPAVLGFR